MFCLAGFLFLNFAFVVLGENLHCQFTSNNQSNTSTAVLNLHQSLVIKCLPTLRNNSNFTLNWPTVAGVSNGRVLSIINITAVKSGDAGIYECVINHRKGLTESCEFWVIVKAPPSVMIGRYDGRQQKMYLPCFITGYYKPSKVVWYKNNAQIFTNETEFFVESKEEDNFTITYALQKNYPSPDDAALYSCKATNVYGASARANRNVTRCMISASLPKKCPELKDRTKESNVTVVAGSSTSLLCEVVNLPCKQYSGPNHFMLAKLVNGSFRDIGVVKNHYGRIDKGNGILLINFTIVNAEKNDSGIYRCDFIYNNNWLCARHPHKMYNVKVVAPSEVHKKQPNLLVVIVVSVAGALSGLGLVLYVCHLRRKLKAQLYVNCPDDLPELRWDVFVSYSSHDFGWVDSLCQMLEQPPFNLTVCLHQRDWELGRSVVDNMVDSVYCSHKTLIIVSKNYVRSDYCMQELQIAMHSEIASELVRRERIVLIKIDDVSMHCLPRIIRQKSYLDCSDPEHARHLKTNLLRVLPRRETVEEQPLQDFDQQSSDGNNASGSGQMSLEQLHVT